MFFEIRSVQMGGLTRERFAEGEVCLLTAH